MSLSIPFPVPAPLLIELTGLAKGVQSKHQRPAYALDGAGMSKSNDCHEPDDNKSSDKNGFAEHVGSFLRDTLDVVFNSDHMRLGMAYGAEQ